jgi:Zn finger protein HypA/HybF involved in hydrogenase expression
MAKPRKYTDEEFINAVKESCSILQVLKKVGLKAAGGNYKIAKERIKNLGLYTDHWKDGRKRQGWARGKKFYERYRIPLSEILKENTNYQSYKLKNRLIKEKILEQKCYTCGNTEWLGRPIALELEHKNGNNKDNRIENLTLLCPNCHAQTLTYRGKNKRHN